MHGVLFLDELPEFDRRVLEVLREPLESGRISVSRAARQAEFPARFPAGRRDEPLPLRLPRPLQRQVPLHAGPGRALPRRISGPLLDRIDLQHRGAGGAAGGPRRGDGAAAKPSAIVRARVAAARERQLARQGRPNAQLATREIDRYCAPDAAGATLLKQAIARLGLSARAYHRVLKVARTIADLAAARGASRVAHVAEAIQYRRLDRAGG